MSTPWCRLVPGIVFAALLVSCGRPSATPPGQAAEGGPRRVRLVQSIVRPMERVVWVSGTLAAQEDSTLSSKVSGRLQQVAVDVGSVVRAGDVVAQVEPRDYELRLNQARAAVAQARAELGLPLEGEDDRVELEEIAVVKQARALLEEATKNRDRIRSLSAQGIATAAERDSVEANHAVARTRLEAALEDGRTRLAALAQRRTELEIARKQLSDTAIRAPFDGAIQARVAGVGEYVATGTPVVTLVRADPLRLRLDIPERESAEVAVGQEVRVTVEGDTNVYAGRIARLSPALGEQTRTLRAEADVPVEGRLRPGLFARAQVVVRSDEAGVAVPPGALMSFAGLEKVVLVRDGKALERVVTTGRRGLDWVEIRAGLERGESVVLEPAGLRTGQPLQVESENGAAPATGASS